VDREITLREYGRVLWSGRWLILACAVAALIVGLLVTIARPVTYTATARVFLGQPTTPSGIPVSTPDTNPVTATIVLESDQLVRKTAEALGLKASRVRDAVTLAVPRTPGSSGNQPTVATITATVSKKKDAVDIANGYAAEVLASANSSYTGILAVYQRRVDRLTGQVTMLDKQRQSYERQLVTAGGGAREVPLQSVLFSTTQLLIETQNNLDDNEIFLGKAKQIEAPRLISESERATSSGSAPKRLQTVLLALLLGLLIGALATFVWRGSPAGRAHAT
jgi:uncharacterized protein involved in exopolysaccharide biosynthesis